MFHPFYILFCFIVNNWTNETIFIIRPHLTEGRKESHNNFSSEPHSPHFLVNWNFFSTHKNLYFIFVLTWSDSLKIVLSGRIRHFKKNIERKRILRWLGRGNEDNVARTRNSCCQPSSPRWADPSFLKLHWSTAWREWRLMINYIYLFRKRTQFK